MRLNFTTLANILLILLVGGALWLVERHGLIGDYQIYIVKLIFINAILALSLNQTTLAQTYINSITKI